MFSENEIVKGHRPRAVLLGKIIVFSFGIIVLRLWYLQIFKGEEFYRYSLENRLRRENLKSPRGIIFDRNNSTLVYNVPRFDATIIPQYLKNKHETLNKLSKILDIDSEKIKSLLAKNSGQARYQSITIKKNISRREVAIIETEGFKMPGVFVDTFISREYLDKEIGGHLFGYISEINKEQLPRYQKADNSLYKLGDFVGQAGLEEEHDLDLRGSDGFQFIEVDALGRVRRAVQDSQFFTEIQNKEATPGNNIRLTIDKDLQNVAYKALEGKVGSVVAVDVNTGEILTMVSRPSFDPSKFSRGLTPEYWAELVNDENNPLRDRSIQEHYSPGSTFKTITALAALEEGVINENTEYNCPGYFQFGRRKFHCWKKGGHGKVDVVKAIRESCDVFFYKVATTMDIDVLSKYAKDFGLGEKTNIDLPRETTGLIPSKKWKKDTYGQEWHLGETLSCAIGQSFVLATPLQLAMSYAAIANGGKHYKPILVKEIFDNEGNIIFKNQVELKHKVDLKEKTVELIKEGLYEVVNNPKGTAYWHRGKGIDMSGKTGTSQVIKLSSDKVYNKCEDYEYRQRHHALFVSFAPTDKPKIAIAVIVEHGCHGSSAAAPVAEAVAGAYMEKYLPGIRGELIKKEQLAFNKIKKEAQLKEQQASSVPAKPAEQGEVVE